MEDRSDEEWRKKGSRMRIERFPSIHARLRLEKEKGDEQEKEHFLTQVKHTRLLRADVLCVSVKRLNAHVLLY